MERQTIVIQYVGESPAMNEVLVKAAVSAITAIANNGFYVDTTVDPTVTHFTENDVAQVVAMMANKAKAKSVTIKVENSKPALSREDGERLIRTIKGLFDV